MRESECPDFATHKKPASLNCHEPHTLATHTATRPQPPACTCRRLALGHWAGVPPAASCRRVTPVLRCACALRAGTPQTELKSWEGVLAYNTPDLSVTSHLINGTDMMATVYHNASSSLSTGLELTWKQEKATTGGKIAAAYSYEDGSAVKFKLDQSLGLGLAYTQDLRKGLKLGLAANVRCRLSGAPLRASGGACCPCHGATVPRPASARSGGSRRSSSVPNAVCALTCFLFGPCAPWNRSTRAS